MPAAQYVTQVVITTRTLWRGVGVVLTTLAGLWAVNQARELTSMLVISLFFAIALVPGVNHLHNKKRRKRGAAVGFIYLAGILVLALLTLVLIPNIAQLAERVGQDGTRWLTGLDRWTSDTFGIHIVSAEASRDAAVTKEFLGQWSDKLVGAASGVVSSGVGFVFNVATIATFTFYIAAGFLARAGLPVLVQPGPPAAPGMDHRPVHHPGRRVPVLAAAAHGDQRARVLRRDGRRWGAIGLAIALAIFGGFVSAFIPGIGTYIGGAIPIALTPGARVSSSR